MQTNSFQKSYILLNWNIWTINPILSTCVSWRTSSTQGSKPYPLIERTKRQLLWSATLELEKVPSWVSWVAINLWSSSTGSSPPSTQSSRLESKLDTRSTQRLPSPPKWSSTKWLSMTVLGSRITKERSTKFRTRSSCSDCLTFTRESR